MNRIVIVAAILFLKCHFAPFVASCQTSDFLRRDTTRTESEVKKNHLSNLTAIEAIENASIAGAAGKLIGQQMDQQAEELKRIFKRRYPGKDC